MNIKRTLGATVASLGLVMGLASGFAGALSSIDTTGPDSINTISDTATQNIGVTNANDVTANHVNAQAAVSSAALVDNNTTGGDAQTGKASNDNSFTVSATVDNSGMGAAKFVMDAGFGSASIDNTGPTSLNTVTFDRTNTVTVDNTNTLLVNYDNTQTATSGAASVTGNTTGGSAITGDALNTSSASMTFHVTN